MTGQEPAFDDAPATATAPRRGWRLTHRGVLAALVVLLALAQVVLLGLRDERLSVPFALGGDAHAGAMLLKNVVQDGWVDDNPRVGAPLGQHILDQPQPDVLHLFLGGTVLGNLSGGWASGMNLYYLLIPILAALAMAWLLRRLGVSPPVTLVASALFGMAPYHFARNEYHLFLSATFPIPLACFLVLGALGVLPLFERRPDGAGPGAWVTRGSLATVLAVIVVGASGAYYAVFALLLLGSAILIRLAATRSIRTVFPAVVVAGAVAGVQVLCLAPAFLWRMDHGANPGAIERPASDTELYALKPAQLVLPSQYHRVDTLKALTRRYLQDFPLPSEGGQALGFVGAAGFLGSLAACVAALAGGARSDPRVLRLGGLNLILVLFGTVGGASTIVALLVTRQFRAGNRVSIFILGFSLIAVAFWLDALRRRWDRGSTGRRAMAVGLAALLVLGLLDQTSPDLAPASSRFAGWDSDASLVHEIERRLGPGAMVYQLPFVRFPEYPAPVRMHDYDHLRGYLHSHQLRWSYGGMKHRAEGEWPRRLIGLSPTESLRAISVLGFRGVYIDRFGYVDNGALVEKDWGAVLGAPPVVSPDGRLSFFDITAFAERVVAELPDDREAAIRKQLLAVPEAEFHEGFYGDEESASERWNWMTAAGELDIVTDTPSKTPVVVSFRAEATRPGRWATVLIDDDGRRHPFVVTEKAEEVRLTLTLDTERTRVRIETEAPDDPGNDPRDLHIRLIGLRLGEDLRTLLAR